MNQQEPQIPPPRDVNRPSTPVADPPAHAGVSWLRRWGLWRSRVFLLMLIVVAVLIFLAFTTEVIVNFWDWVVRWTILGP
jgi:hypothetical protein